VPGRLAWQPLHGFRTDTWDSTRELPEERSKDDEQRCEEK